MRRKGRDVATDQATGQGRLVNPAGSLLRQAVPVMGTVFSFAVGHPSDVVVPRGQVAVRVPPQEALDHAVDLLHRLDAAWSPFRPDSFVARMRAHETLDPAVEDPDGVLGLDVVLRRCRAATRLTVGAFDAWALPDGFDPSGVVKGWAVERALAELTRRGLADVAVSGGGDLAARGCAPGRDGWRIGVRDPRQPGALLGALTVRGGGAVATSGFYERGAHIHDPRRPAAQTPSTAGAVPTAGPGSAGVPLTGVNGDLVAVTVAGPELAWCDVVATALLVEGTVAPAWRQAIPTYRALAVHRDGRVDGDLLEELEPAGPGAATGEVPDLPSTGA